MRIIRKVNDQLAASRFESNKIVVIDWNAPAVSQMNPKRSEWLRVQNFADLFNLHTVLLPQSY